jgi:hypothetical protein
MTKLDMWPEYWHSPRPFEERLQAHMDADLQHLQQLRSKLSHTLSIIRRGEIAIADSKKLLAQLQG